ncbi:coiled-coil domain-containing protein 39-like [Genypterus blacodes]|uniref:coiled-coil domain-containing protein 39-like n=1 Tax=Genypterus blacodes TaxID=154954 RepID=UPI003F76C3B2
MASAQTLSLLRWEDEFNSVETNAENKALIEKMYLKEEQLMQLENKCETNKEEIQVMTDLYQNFQRELKNMGVICCAKDRETELEKHLTALEERETCRLVQDSKKMREERRTVAERKAGFENNTAKAEEKLEAFKQQMTWTQLTLDAFLEESAKTDEETMAIIKYTQQEEEKIKSLTFNIEKTTHEANGNHKVFDKELTETLAMQMALDKTMDSLQQIHQDRQQLIHLWEKTIDQRKCRDAEMQRCAVKLAQLNQDFREKRETLKERRLILETQQRENKEPEKELYLARKQAVKKQEELKEQESVCIRLQDELYCGKGALNKATTEVSCARSLIASIKKDIREIDNKVQTAKAKNEELEAELNQAAEASLNEEQKASKMEALVKEQQQAIKDLDLQLRHQRDAMVKAKQRLKDLLEKKQASLTVIARSKCTISSQGSQLQKQERELYKEQKTLRKLESLVAHQNGQQVLLPDQSSIDEKEQLEKKVSELTSLLQEKKRLDAMLGTLLRECEGGTRLLRKETARSEAQNRDLRVKVEHLQQLSEANDKELNNVQIQKQEAMVEYNIMRFETKRFRDLLYNKEDSLLTLESRKLKLQRDIEEREEEDKVYKESLSRLIKICEDERKRLSVELNERLAKVDMMKNRFEILAISMAAPEGNEEKSQIYYIIKAVQEKEEIDRVGERLAARIQEVELQNKAMENSIQLFSDRNTAFRKTIYNVTKSGAEHQEKLKLEEQLRAAEEKHIYKKGQIQQLQNNIEVLRDTMEDILQDETPEKQKERYKLSIITKLNKETNSKREKTDRAKTKCSKMTREIRSAKNTRRPTSEEKIIRLRQSRGSDKTFHNMLREIMGSHSGLKPVLQRHFKQANLTLPAPSRK